MVFQHNDDERLKDAPEYADPSKEITDDDFGDIEDDDLIDDEDPKSPSA